MADTDLVTLLKLKFELLLQLAPVFILGIHWTRLRSGATLLGIVVGVALVMGMAVSGNPKLAGIHAGVYGLAVNVLIAVGGSLRVNTRQFH